MKRLTEWKESNDIVMATVFKVINGIGQTRPRKGTIVIVGTSRGVWRITRQWSGLLTFERYFVRQGQYDEGLVSVHLDMSGREMCLVIYVTRSIQISIVEENEQHTQQQQVVVVVLAVEVVQVSQKKIVFLRKMERSIVVLNRWRRWFLWNWRFNSFQNLQISTV